MTPDKIIACNADEVQQKIQPLLDKGYTVTHTVSENVASHPENRNGYIVFVLKWRGV